VEIQLVEMIASLLDLSEDAVTDELSIDNCEAWDSLRHMMLISSLEENFGIELVFDEIAVMRSVKDIKKILAKKVS
jgi:acyl carrier protein